MTDSTNQPQPIAIGKIGRPHGVRGEVRLFLYNPGTDLLEEGLVLHVLDAGRERELVLDEIRITPKHGLAKFEGVDGREEAEELTNLEVGLDRSLFPEPEDPEEFYLADVVGLPVFGRQSPDDELVEIGKVEGFLESVDDVLVVTGPRVEGRFFVPLRGHCVETVDIAGGRVVIEPLDVWAPEDVALLPEEG